ncbi:MAG: beta-glucanase (GH16 family) [Flavobacterium sp.]|jgi:beta-glucanase (GH16 family)
MNIYIKNSRRCFFLFCAFSLLLSCSADEKQTVTTLDKLVLQDEFNIDGAPDSALWNYDIGKGPNGDGWGNNELQYYTDRPENIIVENGMLKITAIRELYMGSGFTSARITTKGKFEQQYGRFEARMKLPSGKGLWPAFWMLGNNIDTVNWPQCGEIDIMENKGSQPITVSGALHGPVYTEDSSYIDSYFVTKAYSFTNSRVDTDFHIYGIEWGPNYVNFYVDNVLYNQITPEKLTTGEWVFNSNPFYMLLNLAVGGNFDGSPNSDTVFPQEMLVDYVRVYQ